MVSAQQSDLCCRPGAPLDDCYVWLPGDVTVLACGGAGSACACRRSDGGHALQMDCDDATSTCTCSTDGVSGPPVRTSLSACATQDTRAAAWVLDCHFPR